MRVSYALDAMRRRTTFDNVLAVAEMVIDARRDFEEALNNDWWRLVPSREEEYHEVKRDLIDTFYEWARENDREGLNDARS